MAAVKYRRVRHSPESALALIAASQPIPDPTTKQFKNPISLAGRMGWQTESWELMDRVGELRYYVSWRASSCSKVRLVASELDEEGTPTGKCRNPRVRDIVSSVGGNRLGAAQFIKRCVEGLTVPGEVFQGIIVEADGTERWLAFSRDEIRKTGQNTTVTMPNGEDHVLTADDSLWRTWNPHPRYAKDSDSPVRACRDALREIVRTTATIADAAKSRMLGAGIVFVPQEMSLPAADSPAPGAVADAGFALQGVPAMRQLEEIMYQIARVSYEDDESFARMIPIFCGVPGEQIKNVNHLKFDTEFTDTAIKTRNDAIARLALGLDVSPERLLGLGTSSNHWSAWAIGDNDVQMHIAPVMETICESLTDRILRPMLIEEGIDPTKYLVWYDPSQLTVDPDKSTDATNAFDRGVITADAYREFLGLGATGYDLTNGGLPEWQRWAADQVSNEPTLIATLYPLLPKLQSTDFPVVDVIVSQADQAEAQAEAAKNPPQPQIVQAPQADTTNEGNAPNTKNNAPGENQGNRGKKSTVDKVGKRVDHQDAFLSVFVARALELAGKRRRGRMGRSSADRLRGYKAHEFHRIMGPVSDMEIPELIDGWDDTLEDEVLAMLGVDRDDFAASVRQEVRRQLTAAVITV